MDAPLVASGEQADLRPRQAGTAFRLGLPAAATLLIALYAIVVSRVLPGNVDVSWLLTVGDRVLSGERLYVDVAEANPPFSTWLYLPFLVLERLTGLSAELWVGLGMVVLAIGSVWLSARILVRADQTLTRFVWAVPALVFLLLALSPADFGQREQIAVICLLPWLALLAARDRTADFRAGSTAERLAAGIGAAIFVMIKPPFSVLALAAPVLVLAAQRRSARPLLTTENVFGAVLTVGYLVVLVIFMRPFFTDVLPLLREVYLPMRLPVVDMLMLLPVKIFVAMAAATLAMAYPDRPDRDAKVLLLAGVGYVPGFVVLGKGWTYQAMPFLTLGMLAFVLQFIRLRPQRDLPGLARAGVGFGLLLLVTTVAPRQGLAFVEPRGDLDAATAAINRIADHPTFISIGSALQIGNPLVRMTGARMVGRHPSGWMVNDAQVLIESGPDTATHLRLEALRADYTQAIASELATKRPDIVADDGTAGPDVPIKLHLTQPHATAPLRDSPLIAKALQDYRLLYQNASVTLFIRSDIAERN
ncbi:hypothetical protein [Mesorhizobium sp. CA12]|uniref:hypothetical protein n=1 Tax=Mesorhizobium sp. CA12 TaxID=2876644 RepID=UPI001CCB397C|nr:hypothetical protein [Mesorhizobium sp. CA12]MBZ9862658.1 hypothetical protein [Mesorhizobium sp. CA12]